MGLALISMGISLASEQVADLSVSILYFVVVFGGLDDSTGEHTPIYNTSIPVTKKPVSGIYFFGHFLVRLSGNERS